MTTLLKSQLNPLADSFFPTNCLSTFKNKRIVELIASENEFNKRLHISEEQDSNDKDYKHKIEIAKIDKNFVSKDSFFFSSITSISTDSKNCSIIDQKSCMLGSWPINWGLLDLKLPSLPQKSNMDKNLCMLQNSNLRTLECYNDYYQSVTQKSNNKTPKNKVPIGENECICPPMFGWIVPPDFLGNPFNYEYECCKKYPHSPISDTDINGWTLDQCKLAMQDIVKDVIDAITVDSDATTEWDEENECLEMSDKEIEDAESNGMESHETEISGLDPVSKTLEPELNDDGVHPLLMEAPAIEEDEKDLVEKAEIILEKSLSPIPQSILTFELGAVGDPCSQVPCTQWCDCLPSDARETFNRFFQKSGKVESSNEVYHRQQSSIQRPLFKRSFSADDAPVYGRLSETSTVETRDMLLLRRKDPMHYFQIRSSDSLVNGRKHKSCDLTDQQLYTNSNVKSSMWGKFDGADSLWTPLPECTPLNAIDQKPYIHKRGRDIRRQKTT